MKQVKLLLAFLAFALIGTSLQAQQDKSKRPSPPAVAKATINGADIVIDYSSPAVKGRKLYGKLIPSGKPWRTGANEATTFEISKDVSIEGKTLSAGKYALFTIGSADEWTIIFNKEASQWGAYGYDADKDALRVKVKPSKAAEFAERMAFKIKDDGMVHLLWGDINVAFAVQ
ncbi:MAG: DUF2911 domain-containing protein [Bacteroidota bacterium]